MYYSQTEERPVKKTATKFPWYPRLAENILVKNFSDSNVYMLGISLLRRTSSPNRTLTLSFTSVRDPLFWRTSDLVYSPHLKLKKTDPRSLKVCPKSQNCLNSREGPDLGPFQERRFSRIIFPYIAAWWNWLLHSSSQAPYYQLEALIKWIHISEPQFLHLNNKGSEDLSGSSHLPASTGTV